MLKYIMDLINSVCVCVCQKLHPVMHFDCNNKPETLIGKCFFLQGEC